MYFQETLIAYQNFYHLTDEEMRSLLCEKVEFVSQNQFQGWRYGGTEPKNKDTRMRLQRFFNPWLEKNYGESLEFHQQKKYSRFGRRAEKISLEDPDKKFKFW